MSVATMTAAPPIKNLGWRVALAGMGINLALGVLYSWSVVSKEIPKEWNWSEADRALPYSVACLIFSLVMVPAGRMQDRLGPRLFMGPAWRSIQRWSSSGYGGGTRPGLPI